MIVKDYVIVYPNIWFCLSLRQIVMISMISETSVYVGKVEMMEDGSSPSAVGNA